MDLQIIIDNDGTVRFIYDDSAMELAQALGLVSIARASHVEPTADGRWTADMSPCAGPVLGPFLTRKEALDAEHHWLEQNGLPPVLN